MPPSVLVLSDDPNLMESVRSVLLPDGRFIAPESGLHCDGSVAPLTNIYPVRTTDAEWDGWEAEDLQMPDPRLMSVLIFECRDPAWVAEVGALLARGLDGPVWFVDSQDTAWPAGSVDSSRIVLA